MAKTSRRRFGKQLAGAVAVLPVTGLAAGAREKQRSMLTAKSPMTGDGDPNYTAKMEGDPPVIVGGGGSTYIWVLKTLSPGTSDCPNALLPLANPAPDYPIDMTKYNCYDIQVDLASYGTHDGQNQGGKHPIKVRKKHRTKFYVEPA